jgi:hypothetical protein
MSAPVISPRSKLRLIVLLGLLAPVWWTWLVGRMTYGVYLPSFVLGLVTGIAVALLSKESPLRGWVIFCASVVVGAAFQSVLTNAGLWDCLAALFGSHGNLLFWAGSLIWPFACYARARRSAA